MYFITAIPTCTCTSKQDMPICLTIFTERETAQFQFQFHINTSFSDLTFKIHCKSGEPFYEVGLIFSKNLSSEERYKRYEAKLIDIHNDTGTTETTIYYVRVIIKNVSREDAGTFMCEGYMNSTKIDGYKKICGLHVNTLPGKASCEKIPITNGNSSKLALQCTASKGSLRTSFQCFQNGTPVQQKTTAKQLYNHMIQQVLWIQSAYPAGCCSAMLGEPTECFECNDYVWNSGLHNATTKSSFCLSSVDTSPTAFSRASIVNTVHQPPSVNKVMHTTEEMQKIEHGQTPCNNTSTKGFTIMIAVMCVLVVIIVILILFFTIRYKQCTGTCCNEQTLSQVCCIDYWRVNQNDPDKGLGQNDIQAGNDEQGNNNNIGDGNSAEGNNAEESEMQTRNKMQSTNVMHEEKETSL